jgi:hypothetical protein
MRAFLFDLAGLFSIALFGTGVILLAFGLS